MKDIFSTKKLYIFRGICTDDQLRKTEKVCSIRHLGPEDSFDAVLEVTVCLDKVILVHVGDHVHDSGFQHLWDCGDIAC